jgi:acyl-CoA thioester hydrolase
MIPAPDLLPSAWEHVWTTEVAFGDTDMFGHTNNAVYLRWLESARIRWFRRHMGDEALQMTPFVLAEVLVKYRRPTFFDETLTLHVRLEHVGNRSFALGYEVRRPDGEVAATARTVQVFVDAGLQQPAPVPDAFRVMVATLEAAEDA